jgi:predicted permease
LLRGLRTAEALDLGFRTAGVVYADYDPRAARYSASRAAAFNAALVESAAAIPGVTNVALTSHVPLHGGVRRAPVRLVGATGALAEQHAILSTVSSGYFSTLQIPFVAGRGFDDGAAAQPSVVVSEGLARRFWPGRAAVGNAVSLGDGIARTVVGVVRDASNGAIWRDKELAVYLPIDRATDPRDLRLLARTSGDPAQLRRLLAVRAGTLAADLRFVPMALDELLRLWNLPSKIAATGAAVLAAMAVALACIGLFGVLTFAVTERTRELGIRMALGADARRIVRLVLRDAMRLAGAGLAIGALIGLAAAPLLGRLLFGVRPFDPLTFTVVAALLTAVSLATAYVPARRASRLEPLTVLRTE